jgi:hypothetical protein
LGPPILPPAYAAYRLYGQHARRARRDAERLYRELVGNAVSDKTASRFAMFGIPSGGPTCGACGAPLAPEPDALCAPCDDCLAESWLAAVPGTHVVGTTRAKENLASLVLARDLHTFELTAFVIISTVVVGGFIALIDLMDSRALRGGRCSRVRVTGAEPTSRARTMHP